MNDNEKRDNNTQENEMGNKKISLREMWKDRRGKAKIKLALYGIFFVGVLLFAKVSSYVNPPREDNNTIPNSFILALRDNYEYDMEIEINDNKYTYHGRKLGNNENLKVTSDKEEYYYIMNNKYYILDNNGNYILTTKEEVYPYIDNHLLNINYIKELLQMSVKVDNENRVELSKMILNSASENYITIELGEDSKKIVIDYTELLKLDDDSINKAVVTITYSNIDKIISLEE